MAKHHLLKSIEIAAIVLFVLILAYLAITGILSSTGMDHAWPYPTK
ncbi:MULTISPECIES: hypothetical protein [Pantoea]|jgi:hypothetical protein|nr:MULTISPECIES: hypothetical protein [Pantoea]KAF6655987.1 hypothetical protein HFD91_17760 [Enterobacteriaceae bacterium EKM102V]EIB98539.1 hypothetical protein S7A_08495 [Pantoea sp. Sc1]KAF6665387.1 hypothetical protein HFD97_17780 [Pantoea sp. EKM103V]KAF6668810.1 hypothetical protein HFD92_00895 [Pantoea sp. EKM101V]MEB5704822.1 hypothetical protein [Pantoea anthophila]